MMTVQIQKIVDLRPKSDRSTDISESLHRVAEEREKATAVLDGIKAIRGATLVSGTAKEIEAQDKAVGDLTRYIEDLDVFSQAVAPQLPEARKREKIAALRAQIAEIGRDEKVTAFVEAFGEYAHHAQAIARIMELEKEAQAATELERVVRRQLEALGEESGQLQAPYQQVTGGPLKLFKTLGDMVRLPGVLGAPAIPSDPTAVWEIVYVTVPDWDSPNKMKTRTGLPVATKVEAQKRQVGTMGPVRQDVPIWWPDNNLERGAELRF